MKAEERNMRRVLLLIMVLTYLFLAVISRILA